MQRLIHPDGNQSSARMLQQQAEAENYSSVVTTREDVCYAKASPQFPASQASESALPVYCGLEVDARQGKFKQEETLRISKDELRQLSKQLLTIQECERQRIAADLHDGIGQSLSLIQLSLELAIQKINAGEIEAAVESMRELTIKVKATMAELRRTTMDMRPSMLDDLGIIPTLSWFFREFESVWSGRMLHKDVCIVESDVPASLKTTIFRILQEAMNNIVKHANADSIKVCLKKSVDTLQLSVEDNGQGFDLEHISASHASGRGFGLLTMKERARSSDGTFEMKSDRKQGTRILVSWRFAEGTARQAVVQLPRHRKLVHASTR